MRKEQLQNLHTGDIVLSKLTNELFIVSVNYGDCVFAGLQFKKKLYENKKRFEKYLEH